MSQSLIQTDVIPSQRTSFADSADFASLPACPSWCALPEGHPYDCLDAKGEFSRVHCAFGDGSEGVDVIAVEAYRDGTVNLVEPEIMLYSGNGESLSADEARELAALLLKVADRHEEITRG